MNNFAATFSHELNSMHREARPCSKSRLEHLGELSALAIKDYKQVVYDVENFINTCHDEHKLAGVYVMDAILKRARQAKNSSYATKFARNIYLNMQHIFMRAKLSHKPKIVRVLNIWQKNQIFPPEIIQPMLDLANPNAKFEPKVCTLSTSPLPLIAMRYTRPTPCGSTTTTTVSSSAAWLNNKNASANNNSNNNNNGNNTTSTAGCTTMVSSITYGDYKNQMRDNGQATSGGANNGKHGHGSVGTASMTMTTTTTKTTTATSASTSMSWSRRHKGEVAAPAAAAAAADDLPKSEEEQMTELVQLLHKMIKATGLNWENLTPEDIEKSMRLEARIQAGEQLEQEDWEDDEELGTPTEAEPRYSKPKNGENGRMPIDKRQVVAKIGELRQISLLVQNLFANQDFINQIQAKAAQAQLSDRPFLENVMEMMKIGQMVQPMFTQKIMDLAGFRAMIKTCLTVAIEASEKAALAAAAAAAAAAAEAEAAAAAQNTNGGQFHSTFQPISSAGDVDDRQQEQQQQQQSSTQRSGRHYSRSRSPSRSREYRSSGRSRDYDQRSSRLPPELDYREDSPYTAHQKERKRKGLPPIRPKFMSVCSTTLWVGHLPKYVSENDVADLFDKYGLVSNIDLIPSRGCAFVSMNRRQDATKAYNGLKAEPRVSGYTVKCAWAPGKGMKEKKYKDYWEADVGCSYIPFSMLHTEIDLDELEEGGVIDDETVPQPLKAAHQARVAKKEAEEKEKSQMLKSIQYTTVTTPATVAPAMVALPGLGLASVNALGMPVLGVPPQMFGPVLGAPPPPPPPPPPAVPMVPSYPPPPMPSYRPAVAGPPILPPPPPPGVMHHHPIPPPMHGPMHGGGPPPGYHPGPGPMGHPPPPLPPPPGVMPPHLQQPPPPALLPRPAKVSRWGMMTNEKHAKSKQLGAPSPKKAKLAPTLSAMSDTNSSKLSPEAGPAVPKLGKISFNLKTTKSVLAKLDKREEEVSDDKSEPIARDNVDDDNDKEKMFIDNDDDKEITELVIDETAEDHDDEDDRNSVEVEKQHNDMDISIDSPGGRSTKITEHEHGNGGEGHAGSTNDDDADEEKTAAADGHKRGKKPKRTLLPLVEEPAASMYNPQLHVPEQQYHGPRHAFAPHMQHPRPEEFFGPPGMGPPPPPPGRPDFEMFHGNGEYNPPPPPMGPFPPGPNHLRAGFGHPMPPPRHNARPDGMFGPRMPHRFNDGPRFPNGGGPGPFFDGPRARFMPPNEPHMFGRNMPMPPEMFGPYDGPPEMYFDGPPPPGPHGGPPPHLVHGPRPRWDRPPQPFWQQQQQPGGPRGHPRNMRPPWQAAQRFEGGGGQQRRAENGKLNGGQHKEAKPKSTNIFDNPVEGLDEIDEVAAEDNGHEVQGPT